MKIKDILILILVTYIAGWLFYNDYKLGKETKELEQIVYSTEKSTEKPAEYLQVPDKSKIDEVIGKYYEEFPVTTRKIPKTPYTAKITTSTNINLKDIKVIDQIAVYIKVKEGFRAKAYKDNTQYSIGYGTRARYKTEVITVKEANIRLYKHIRKVIVPAFKDVKFNSIEQVYSAIDFSYNLGHNRFKREVVDSKGNIDCSKMMAYNKVRDKHGNLVYNEGLAKRRFENFLACTSYEVIK